MKEPEVAKIQQIRRLILEALNMMYPTAQRAEQVYRVCISIDPGYEWHLFEKDIFYLKEKGYLEFLDDAIGLQMSFRKKTIKLTAAGKEIADRTQTDPALEI